MQTLWDFLNEINVFDSRLGLKGYEPDIPEKVHDLIEDNLEDFDLSFKDELTPSVLKRFSKLLEALIDYEEYFMLDVTPGLDVELIEIYYNNMEEILGFYNDQQDIYTDDMEGMIDATIDYIYWLVRNHIQTLVAHTDELFLEYLRNSEGF